MLLISFSDAACKDMRAISTSLHALRRGVAEAGPGAKIPATLIKDINALQGNS